MCLINELFAQIVVHDQRYQVENMPQPKSFTFYNSFAVPSESIETSVIEYSYQKRYHRFTGNPIPIANKEGLNISMGFGYATDLLQINSLLISNKNQAIWTQLYTTGSIGDSFYWRGIYAVGTYSTKINFKNTSTYKHTILAQFGKKWSESLATGLGVLVLSNFDDIQYVPIAHVSYSTGAWVIDTVLPNDLSVRYILNNKLHFLVVNTLVRRSYYNTDLSLANKFSINEIGFQTELNITGVLWAELTISKPYGLKSETQNNSDYTEIGKISQQLSVSGGLFIRFKEKYK